MLTLTRGIILKHEQDARANLRDNSSIDYNCPKK